MIKLKDFNLDIDNIDIEIINKIDGDLAKKYNIVPLKIDNDCLFIAMNDLLDDSIINEIELNTNLKVIPVFMDTQIINKLINTFYSHTHVNTIVNEFKRELDEKLKNEPSNIDSDLEIENSPAVKFVNSIIEQAISKNSSDIHIEPLKECLRIRLRIDGYLYELLKTDKALLNSIISRIKILAKLNIAEKRIPQDGHINLNSVDIRVSTLPTIYGEKVVMRLIYCDNILISKDKIGFFEADLIKFNKLLMNNNGIILVTGPTGSGKSTTLASAMLDLNNETLNLVSVEEPVENLIAGVNQISIDSKTGIGFNNILRSILRQDPDIIMIGEIRDTETAQIAMRAAITGHLVLSTLHTNDAVSSVMRLNDMGIEAYMIAAAVRGILAQRLVRRLCPFCSEEIEISEIDANLIKVPKKSKIKKAKGCKHCHYTGYKGRFAVYEIFIINPEIRQAISHKVEYNKLKELAIKAGMVTLQQNTLINVLNGNTSLDEFYRVIYTED